MLKTMVVLLGLIGLCVASCATTGLRVTGNETSVIIVLSGDVAEAFPLAETHCARFGKVAHFNHMDGARQCLIAKRRASGSRHL